MFAFFEQKRDQAFDRQQMNALRGGCDSGGPLAPDPDDDEDSDDGGG